MNNGYILTSYAEILKHLPITVYGVKFGQSVGQEQPDTEDTKTITHSKKSKSWIDFFDDNDDRSAHIQAYNLERILCYITKEDAERFHIEKTAFQYF